MELGPVPDRDQPDPAEPGADHLPGGYKVDETVYSLTKWDSPTLSIGMRGIVVGPCKGQQVSVKFESPGDKYGLYPKNICRLLPGGYKPGDTVFSLTKLDDDRHGHVHFGMQGKVTCPGATKGKVTVKFENPGGLWNMHPRRISRTKIRPEDVKLPGGYKIGEIIFCVKGRKSRTDDKEVEPGMRGKVVGFEDSKEVGVEGTQTR